MRILLVKFVFIKKYYQIPATGSFENNDMNIEERNNSKDYSNKDSIQENFEMIPGLSPGNLMETFHLHNDDIEIKKDSIPFNSVNYYPKPNQLNVADGLEKLITYPEAKEKIFNPSKIMDSIQCQPLNMQIINLQEFPDNIENREVIDPLDYTKIQVKEEPKPLLITPYFTPCHENNPNDDFDYFSEHRPFVEKCADEQSVSYNIPDRSSEILLKTDEIPNEYKSEENYFMELCMKNQWVTCEQLLRTFKKESCLTNYKNHETGETPLMFACRENRLVIVERLLDIEVNVNAKSMTIEVEEIEQYVPKIYDLRIFFSGLTDGRNALHYAAKYSNYEIVKLLLSKKADANIFENTNKYLPLHLACNRTVVPSGLISNLLKVTRNGRLQKDKNGSIPLMFAVENGLIMTIKELLEKDVDAQINMKRKESGDNALHIACRKNDLESARLLCEAGAAINAQNNLGQTPLHICAEENSELVLKYLYNNKANANILDNKDRGAIYMAAVKGNTKLVEFLIDKYKSNILTRDKDGNTLMHITSMCGFEETTMSFLRRGVPLHMPNKNGSVCLHTAAQQGHINVVRALLEKGANVNARTKDLYTPLHIAVKYGHPGVVEILIGYGAEANCKGGLFDEFPLHIAAVSKSGDNCFEMLLKSGANVNAVMKTGETVLHVVSKMGNLEMVKSLFNEGACPIIQCNEGNSSFHVAVKNCHFHVVKEFVKFINKNMNRYDLKNIINQLNKNGETSMHFAVKLGKDLLHSESEDVDIIKLLLENGGDIKITNMDNDESPLHYCAAAGNSDILTEIVQFYGNEMHNFVNKQTKNGWSPLLFASDNGHHKSVEILLQNDSRVDLFDEYGMTALHLAAEKGHSEVAEILLTNKSFVNAKSKHGLTPLHMAAQNGHKNLVELLIRKYNAAVDLKTLNGKTPLHMAAEQGQIDVCKSLLFDKYCCPDPSASDTKGQTPMHLAAKNDHPEVVKLFLRYKPELLMVNNLEGMNCVHLAASKGSLSVVKEFMRFNKFIIHEVRNKSSGSTPLHLAIEGGHLKVVKTLLDAGANPCDENNEGMTGLHIAAKYGHILLLEYLKSKVNLMFESKKTGMTALHIASHYGQIDFVRELLVEVPAHIKSKLPKSKNNESQFTDSGLTALHLASQSGHENLVRLLLNYSGVEVDSATDSNGTIPLHLAVLNGHISVTSLLLSKSATQLTKKDRKGRTALHLVSSHGHLEITVLLIGQGADINDKDNLGFTPLHYAAKSGYLKVCKLLVESGAKCNAQTNDFNIPLIYAAKCNHTEVVSYLLHNNHSTEKLMADNKFLYDMMICSKINNFKTIEEFILLSPAPAEIAAKLSKLFIYLSEKEKERSKDLTVISEYCENMCTDLVALAAYEKGADKLLKSYDRHGVQFLDILIETEQKEVISHPSVHQYMSNVWRGDIKWPIWKFLLLMIFLSFPLSWLTAMLPKTKNLFKLPVIKFIVYLFSHIYLMGLLVYVTIEKPAERSEVLPNYLEWILLIWLAGLFISELVNPVDRSSIAVLRIFVLVFSCVAILVHVSSCFINESYLPEMIYIRNQILGAATFLCFVVTLDFLSFHHLFGPWTVIIRDLIGDLVRFLVFFIVFLFAFACMLAGTFQSVKQPEPEDVIPDIIDVIILLYFCLFGLVSPEDMPDPNLSPPYGNKLSKFVFGFALLMIIIVLINLLIAMMSDTYQRIQDQSDVEWKYGRAKLIRNMKNTTPIASPFIIISQFIILGTRLYYKIKRKPITQVSDDEKDEIESRLRRRSELNSNLLESSSLFKFGPDKVEEVVNWPDIARKYLEIRGISNIIINSDNDSQTFEGKNLN